MSTFTLELNGKALHHYGAGVYGWGEISTTTGKPGRLVEWTMQEEAEDWASSRRVFCTGAVVKASSPPEVPQKRGRGRPVTAQAMTPAEKQAAYRARQSAESQKLQAQLIEAEATILELREQLRVALGKG